MRYLLALVAVLTLGSCRSVQDKRLHIGVGDELVATTSIEKLKNDLVEQHKVQKASIEKHQDFSLGIIEFDDEGISFSREQRQAVTRMIREESNINGAILVAFIHGWKHNASVCDANLACFRSVLGYLGQREAQGQKRRVIGVYLAWRGLEYCDPVRRNLSFWTRKRIGERLGTNQARRAINDLLVLHNEIKQAHKSSRFIAVGHSLGGGVLFSAVGPMYRQALHDAIEERRGDTLEQIHGFQDVSGRLLEFPDLVVLANPAFEAELYKRTPMDLADMRAKNLHFSPQQFPLLLSVSSEVDRATHTVFPIGQALKELLSPVMWLRGATYLWRNIITGANYRPYVTDLASAEGALPQPPSDSARPDNCFRNGGSTVVGLGCDCDKLSPLTGPLTEGSPFGAETRTYGKVQLKRLPGVDKYNPFIVATATREVLRGHNDIFNPTFMSLLIELIHKVDKEKPH